MKKRWTNACWNTRKTWRNNKKQEFSMSFPWKWSTIFHLAIFKDGWPFFEGPFLFPSRHRWGKNHPRLRFFQILACPWSGRSELMALSIYALNTFPFFVYGSDMIWYDMMYQINLIWICCLYLFIIYHTCILIWISLFPLSRSLLMFVDSFSNIFDSTNCFRIPCHSQEGAP